VRHADAETMKKARNGEAVAGELLQAFATKEETKTST
jgi:hypothetical protein